MRAPREPITVQRMMVAVAILGTAMGLVARLARDPVMTPDRVGIVVVVLALWGTVIGFSLLWLFKRVASAIAYRTCRKA